MVVIQTPSFRKKQGMERFLRKGKQIDNKHKPFKRTIRCFYERLRVSGIQKCSNVHLERFFKL